MIKLRNKIPLVEKEPSKHGTLLDFSLIAQKRSGFFGQMIGWFIRVVIYDICVSTIQEVFGVSRLVAIFIFLGILLAISLVGYIFKQKMTKRVDED